MIGRSDLFSNIVCPYVGNCNRPNCHYKHVDSIPAAASLPFIGYVGYVSDCQKTSIVDNDMKKEQSSDIKKELSTDIKKQLPALIDDEILNPTKRAKLMAMDERKQMLSRLQQKTTDRNISKEKKLNDYVKSLADIDRQIVQLEKQIENEKQTNPASSSSVKNVFYGYHLYIYIFHFRIR